MGERAIRRDVNRWRFGAYAEVFFLDHNRALKVFKKRPPSENEHARMVFESEAAAYEIAMVAPELATLVPKFYGRVSIDAVLDERGASIAEQFILDCAYEMEFVPGLFVKMNEISTSESRAIAALFAKRGILHLTDASVTLTPKGKVIRVVDFALVEHELRWN